MSIVTTKYVRKPLYVDAVQVTVDNFEELAAWCQGEIVREMTNTVPSPEDHIKVRVHHPKSNRQTQAHVGDWILYTHRGYKVYTEKAFENGFELTEETVSGVNPHQARLDSVYKELQQPETVINPDAPGDPSMLDSSEVAHEAPAAVCNHCGTGYVSARIATLCSAKHCGGTVVANDWKS